MKSLFKYIDESLFSRDIIIRSEDYKDLLPWLALASSWGKEYQKSYNTQFKACPAITEFSSILSSMHIDRIDRLFENVQSAIKNSEPKLKIDRKTQDVLILLCRYIYDKAYTYTKECDVMHKLQLKLAAQR